MFLEIRKQSFTNGTLDNIYIFNSTGLSSLSDTAGGIVEPIEMSNTSYLYYEDAKQIGNLNFNTGIVAGKVYQNIQPNNYNQNRDQENLKDLNDRLKSVLSSGIETNLPSFQGQNNSDGTLINNLILNEATNIQIPIATDYQIFNNPIILSTASTMTQQQFAQHILNYSSLQSNSPSNTISRRNSVDLSKENKSHLKLNSNCLDSVDCNSDQLNSQLQSFNSIINNNELNLSVLMNSYNRIMSNYNDTLNTFSMPLNNILSSNQNALSFQQIGNQHQNNILHQNPHLDINHLNIQTLNLLEDLFMK